MIFLELAERVGDCLILFVRLDAVVRAFVPEGGRQRHDLFVGQSAETLAAAVRVDREIAGNAEQPATEGGAALERVDTNHGAGQAFLADVLGVVAIGHQMKAEAIESLTVAAKEDAEGDIIATLDEQDQLAVAERLEVRCVDVLRFDGCVHRGSPRS